MKRIAIFGKPGGGKSTLSKKLALHTNIDLYPLDLIEYNKAGERIPRDEFNLQHDQIIAKDSWIIDGLGNIGSFWKRIDSADTLIYVDLPYYQHYWWVLKRYLTSIYVKPEGWPKGCSVLKGTLAGWKYLRLSPGFWTQQLFDEILSKSNGKKVYRIRTVKDLKDFITKI